MYKIKRYLIQKLNIMLSHKIFSFLIETASLLFICYIFYLAMARIGLFGLGLSDNGFIDSTLKALPFMAVIVFGDQVYACAIKNLSKEAIFMSDLKKYSYSYSFEDDLCDKDVFMYYPTADEAKKAALEEKPSAPFVFIGTYEDVSPVSIISGVMNGDQVISEYEDRLYQEYGIKSEVKPSFEEISELEKRLIDTVDGWFKDFDFETGLVRLIKSERCVCNGE